MIIEFSRKHHSITKISLRFVELVYLTKVCCQNLGSLCTDVEQIYGDKVMEERERVALFLFEAKREHSWLAPQELCLLPGG